MDRFMTPLLRRRPLLAVDLPGNGESDNPVTGELTVEAQADWLAETISKVGYGAVDVFGYRGGCCVGIELALRRPEMVKHLAIPTLNVYDESSRRALVLGRLQLPELDEYGTHWICAWNMLRDRELFDPWFKRQKQNIRRSEDSDISPATLQQRTTDLFKCVDIYDSLFLAHVSYPSQARLEQVLCPIWLPEVMKQVPDSATSARARSIAKPMPSDPLQFANSLVKFFS
jgi:pimeloyl-ACP methyl ester carboxylesterase